MNENTALIKKKDSKQELSLIDDTESYNKSLQTFQHGIQTLEKGSQTLKKFMAPNIFEKGLSLLSERYAERIRLRRLSKIDVSNSKKSLLKEANEVLNSLNYIIDSLNTRYDSAKQNIEEISQSIEKTLYELKDLENTYNVESQNITNTSDYDNAEGDNFDTSYDKEIDATRKLYNFNTSRSKMRDSQIKYNKLLAQLTRFKSKLKTEMEHAEYSTTMLNKLEPIKEIVEGNKDLLENRLDMLNKTISAGAILKPISNLITDMDNVSSEFAQANSIMADLFNNISIDINAIDNSIEEFSQSIYNKY